MTVTMLRAVSIVVDHGPLSPREFARLMWPDSDGWRRSVKCGPKGSHRGGGMYLAGGGYLGKLAARGLTRRVGRCDHEATSLARAAIEKARAGR